MKKSFQYRAIINKATEDNCIQWLENCRILYNLALEQRKSAYEEHGESITANRQKNQLPSFKQTRPHFKSIGSQVLQDVIERVDKAFKAFFRRVKTKEGKAGFPRFKNLGRYDSFTLKQAGWKLEGRYLYIKNVGRFKLFLSRPIEGTIKTVTIRRTATGKWFVTFSCDHVEARQFPESKAAVGIDVGIKEFCVDSAGNSIPNPEYFRQYEAELRIKQRTLSRRKKGSARRNKAKLEVARLHEKITNTRKDFLHKTANHYIENYGSIAIETLNIKGMVKNRYLSKSIADSSWGKFFEFLSYKAEEAGREVIKVNPRNTSQACSGCGEIVSKSLSVRIHKCPHCGLVLDRDHNAAINILQRAGQALQELTYPVAECVS